MEVDNEVGGIGRHTQHRVMGGRHLVQMAFSLGCLGRLLEELV